MIYAVDPGSSASALVVLDGRRVLEAVQLPNDTLLARLRGTARREQGVGPVLVVEHVHVPGVAGREVFETVWWSGRFFEAWEGVGQTAARLLRRDVKLSLVGQVNARDADVRSAVIWRYGGKEHAVGTRKVPGPLYGVKAHCWQALALALAWQSDGGLPPP